MKIENMVEYLETYEQPKINMEQLSELLFDMNESCLWPDEVDSVGIDQVILCWKIVEYLKTKQRKLNNHENNARP